MKLKEDQIEDEIVVKSSTFPLYRHIVNSKYFRELSKAPKSCDQLSKGTINRQIVRPLARPPHRINEDFKYYYDWTMKNWGLKGIPLQENALMPRAKTSMNLSIVISSRNDNYGGNSRERLSRCLQQFAHFNWTINMELVLVDWNQVVESPPLFSEVEEMFGEFNQTIPIRVIEVPRVWSKRFNLIGDCNMFEYVGKNVGMRRALGEWILITNIDDVFPRDLLTFMDRSIFGGLLDVNGFYAAKRGNVAIHENTARNMFFGNLSGHCTWGPPRKTKCSAYKSIMDPMFVGDFQLFQRRHVNTTGGFLETFFNFGLDSEFMYRNFYLNNLTGYHISSNCKYCHQKHTKKPGLLR